MILAGLSEKTFNNEVSHDTLWFSRNNQATFLLWQGPFFLRLCVLLALFPAILFLFHLSIAPWYFPVILSITLIWTVYDAINVIFLSRKIILIGLIVLACVLAANLAISTWFFDLSSDGRHYHIYSIYLLKNGWNPVYNPFNPVSYFETYFLNWSIYYPKASWYAGATIFTFFQHQEISKAPQYLLLFANLFIVIGNILSHLKLKIWQAYLVGIIIVLNPVQIYQLTTNYIDGQVYACLAIIITTLAVTLISLDRLNLISLSAAIIYAVALKSSAIVYIAIFIVFALIINIFIIKNKRSLSSIIAVCGLSGVIGVFILGYSPYITSTIRYKNPIYPLTISNQEMIMGENRPADFAQEDRFSRFLNSILAPTSNVLGKLPAPDHKDPFTFTYNELLALQTADPRTGGFGPWFSGILLVAGVGLLFFIKRPKILGVILISELPIIISIFSSQEGWWARYAPQTWLLPIIILIGLFFLKGSKTISVFAIVFSVIISINIFSVAYFNLSENITASSHAHQVLQNYSSQNRSGLLYCGDFCNATQLTLREYKIATKKLDNQEELPCPQNIFWGIYISPFDCMPK
jgi:hypothetical protein